MAIKARDKHRLKKVLIVGLIGGAVLGVAFTALIAGRASSGTKKTYQAAEKKLKDENAKLRKQIDDAAAKAEKDSVAAADQLAGDDWALTLINDKHPLDQSYTPTLGDLDDTNKVDSRILDAAKQMISDGTAAGMNFHVVSAYRSYDDQKSVFDTTMSNWIAQGYSMFDAYQETMKSVAVPGTSEHSSGLALDITSASNESLDDSQADTEEAKWLAANCATYGFILRYPTDKTDITGIVYEPWHYRYVGKDAAKEITDKGITLEEYLEQQ